MRAFKSFSKGHNPVGLPSTQYNPTIAIVVNKLTKISSFCFKKIKGWGSMLSKGKCPKIYRYNNIKGKHF